MKKTTFLKIFVLSLIMELGMIMPTTINAQSDGFFRGGETGNYENRTEGMSLGKATPENPTTVPVGSGLLIMVAAGAGYAVTRRRRSYGHGATLIIAFALLLGMTQCKKKEILQTNTDNGVFITFNATYDGDRTVFDPGTCKFSWTKDVTEYIYVGGSEHTDCLGVLSGEAKTDNVREMSFSGTLTTSPVSGEKLYFFYLGSENHAGATIVDFSSQAGSIDYVTNRHIAISDAVEYTGTETSFNATLNMKMAIAYFDLSGFKDSEDHAETVFLHGDNVFSAASVDYKNGSITGTTKGNIMLGKGGKQFVALIPSESTGLITLTFESVDKHTSIDFLRGIQAGKYYSNSDGSALKMGDLTTGSSVKTFTVSGDGKRVVFSPGNLQYQRSTNTWRFAEHQWDFVGGTNFYDNVEYGTMGVNTNSSINDPYYNGWIDLFGWGTGDNPTLATDNNPDYATSSTTIMNRENDWGVNFTSKSNGTDDGFWCTLTGNDWVALLNRENTTLRANGTVNGVIGVILLPDNWASVDPKPYDFITPTYGGSFTANVISDADKWAELENLGCVFLPVGGRRHTQQSNNVYDMTTTGYYWSTTQYSEKFGVYFRVKDNATDCQAGSGGTATLKKFGHSVRLVHRID